MIKKKNLPKSTPVVDKSWQKSQIAWQVIDSQVEFLTLSQVIELSKRLIDKTVSMVINQNKIL